jgi:hypothetical protein
MDQGVVDEIGEGFDRVRALSQADRDPLAIPVVTDASPVRQQLPGGDCLLVVGQPWQVVADGSIQIQDAALRQREGGGGREWLRCAVDAKPRVRLGRDSGFDIGQACRPTVDLRLALEDGNRDRGHFDVPRRDDRFEDSVRPARLLGAGVGSRGCCCGGRQRRDQQPRQYQTRQLRAQGYRKPLHRARDRFSGWRLQTVGWSPDRTSFRN